MRKILLFVFLSLGVRVLFAQDASTRAVMEDYPGLMNIYEDELEKRHAHYIFAIDISSSMLPFEETVKRNFLEFVHALPDGDEITLIKMAASDRTDFVNNCRSIEINSDVRKNFREIIYSHQFQFVRGTDGDGSDGFTMTKKVIEAINDVGSNDLVFVYFFTDFEYWTQHNRYDKSKEDWASLKNKLVHRQNFSMYKYGLELNFNNNSLHKDAIFKDELDDVFGAIEYQGVSDATFLSQWFDQLQANVMAMKLYSVVKQDLEEFTNSVELTPFLSSDDVILDITSSTTIPVVKGLRLFLESKCDNFTPCEIGEIKSGTQKVKIGKLTTDEKSWIPGFTIVGGSGVNANIEYISDYSLEIERLMSLYGEKINSQNSSVIEMPTFRVWNCIVPLWGVIVIKVIIGIIILSIVYTLFFIKLDKVWHVLVSRTDGEGIKTTEFNDEIRTPIEVSSYINRRPVDAWTLLLRGKKYNPLFFWKRSGYYIKVVSNDIFNVDIMDSDYPKDVKETIPTNEDIFLFPKGKVNNVILKIAYKNEIYTVDLS